MSNSVKLILDINNDKLNLFLGNEMEEFIKSSFYKLKLKRFVFEVDRSKKVLIFKESLKYPKYKKIISILKYYCGNNNILISISEGLVSYIEAKEYYINERSNFGLSLKQKDEKLKDSYYIYKNTVDGLMARQLRDKQMWDSFFMTSMKCSCNFSVPGSGKTSSVLGTFAYLKSKGLVDKILMVGPKNSFNSWIDEFNICFEGKEKLNYFNIQNYNNLQKKKRAILYETELKNLLLFNYESLISVVDEVKKIINNKTLLVYDEVHKVKSVNGVRAENALDIAKEATYKIVMTGTPIPNSYLDIRNMLDILYSDDYDDFFGFSESELRNPSPIDIENINHKIQPFFCRTNKEQLNVPLPNKDIIINVNGCYELNKIYSILKSHYRSNKLALIIRLLQLESNPQLLLKSINSGGEDFSEVLDISGSLEDINYKDFSTEIIDLINSIDTSNKFNACIETVKKLNSENKSIIIWCIFVDSIIRLSNKLKSLGISVGIIYGNTSFEERTKILDDFRTGKVEVLITNPHTLAESVSLHSVCHDAIYFEYSYNLVHLLQSKDRIHRLGLNDGQYTQYYFLQNTFFDDYAESFSLDQKIYERLKQKEQVMLDAIEKDVLEIVTTSEEDIDLILGSIGL